MRAAASLRSRLWRTGGVIRAAATMIAGFPEDYPFGRFPLRIDNCSVSVFRFREKTGGWGDRKGLNWRRADAGISRISRVIG